MPPLTLRHRCGGLNGLVTDCAGSGWVTSDGGGKQWSGLARDWAIEAPRNRLRVAKPADAGARRLRDNLRIEGCRY